MTTQDEEPTAPSTLLPLNQLVRSSVVGAPQKRLLHGLNVVSARLELARARRRRVPRPLLAALAATSLSAVALAVFLFVSKGNAPASLTFTVHGGSVVDGGYLKGSRRDGLTMAFSEGSKISFAPGSHGRLKSVDGAGAHVAVETGTASFEITPRSGSRWLVDVGPFRVKVQGTAFTVSWDVARERFELSLERGRVAVSGPASGGDIVLRDGQRLVVDLPTGETLITESPSHQARAKPVPGERPDAGANTERRHGAARAAPPPSAPRAEPAAAPTEKAVSPGWSEAVAAGDWDRILREAEAGGIAQTLANASSEDLMAIADAARYRRRMALARDALLSLRERFPGTGRSVQAAYLLGRVEETKSERLSEALHWYDEYLRVAPRGAYASEALGRKMVLSGKLGRKEQTRALAKDYLQRFPNGTYAGSARVLLRGD